MVEIVLRVWTWGPLSLAIRNAGNVESNVLCYSSCNVYPRSSLSLVSFVINKYTQQRCPISRPHIPAFFLFWVSFFVFLLSSFFSPSRPSIAIVVPTSAICQTKVQRGWRCRLLRATRVYTIKVESGWKKLTFRAKFPHWFRIRSNGDFNTHRWISPYLFKLRERTESKNYEITWFGT